MFSLVRNIFLVILSISALSACSEYNKVLKSNDPDYKLKKAMEYYEAEKYSKAEPLFDELLTIFRGSNKAQDVYYYYAYCHYHMKEYILAGYHFRNFYKTFPRSERAEEALFMTAYCYYKDSPQYSLDQTYTQKAINEFQLYVNTYPGSERLEECNRIMIELRRKLERKSFEIARQYYHRELYNSAVVALNNTLSEYPDSRYREEALFLKLKANFELARNSIEAKQGERYKETVTAYNELTEAFPETDYKKEAERIYKLANEELGLSALN